MNSLGRNTQANFSLSPDSIKQFLTFLAHIIHDNTLQKKSHVEINTILDLKSSKITSNKKSITFWQVFVLHGMKFPILENEY